MENAIEKKERLTVSVSSAVFIEDEQGRLLLVQQAAERKGCKWGPPAGGIEPHENPIDAALREVKEELDIDIELINLLGIYSVDRGEKASGLGFVFRGKIISGKINPKEGEINSFRFYSPQEIEDLIINDQIYKPEYNLDGIRDWTKGVSFPLEVLRLSY